MFMLQEEPIPDEFLAVLDAARRHLRRLGRERPDFDLESLGPSDLFWLTGQPAQPPWHHLAFYLGYRLVFVFVQSECMPFTRNARFSFLRVCRQAEALPCLMPMWRRGAEYQPMEPGWGLVEVKSGAAVEPIPVDQERLVPLNAWERHYHAVQLMARHLEEQGKQLSGCQNYLNVDPQIWFAEGDHDYWVVVRAAPYAGDVPRPPHLDAHARGWARHARGGYFASVILLHHDHLQPGADPDIPLHRGRPLLALLSGLEPVTVRRSPTA